MGCCSSKQIDEPTWDDVPTEPKPVTHAASPKTNASTASDVQVSLPTGRAAGSLETNPVQQAAAPRPRRGSIHEARPQIIVDGSNPPGTPGQPSVPLPSARSRRGSIATQPDEAPKSHHQPSAPTEPDKKYPLTVDELQVLLSESGKFSKSVKAWDRTGQLSERTKTLFSGGFSDVSQAKLGNRVVAVKTLRLTNIKNPEERHIWKRLAREIYVWAALDHPNVLELLGFAIEDGTPCLISPWCENETLQKYLQKFPDANRRRLVREIAEGLRYLHIQEPKIIHGDLKPNNVFVTGDHVAKISDFGCSRRVEELKTGFTTASGVNATFRYSAPEILRDGSPHTLPSDVFSFANVVLETMTDKRPFWKIPQDAGVITEVLSGKTPSSEDYPGVEEAIWELLRRCWTNKPEDRPHMAEVCKMLAVAGYKPSAIFQLPPLTKPSNTVFEGDLIARTGARTEK